MAYGTMTDPVARRIVVGVDGSPASLHAVRWVAGLARRTGAEVLAVTAVTPFEDLLRDSIHFSPGSWRQALRRRMRRDWCSPLADAGIPYKVRLIERHAGPALLQAAEEADADLIVVGVHQHRSLTGRLSAYLGQRASCPVIAVPPTGAADATAAELSPERVLAADAG
jgi:nucleotide-binding universal stress UspA family protein